MFYNLTIKNKRVNWQNPKRVCLFFYKFMPPPFKPNAFPIPPRTLTRLWWMIFLLKYNTSLCYSILLCWTLLSIFGWISFILYMHMDLIHVRLYASAIKRSSVLPASLGMPLEVEPRTMDAMGHLLKMMGVFRERN